MASNKFPGWDLSNGLTICIEPLFSAGFKLDSFSLSEGIGGGLSGGSLTAKCNHGGYETDEIMSGLKEIEKIVISNLEGHSIVIPRAIVTKAVRNKYILSINFVVAPSEDWYTTIRTNVFSGFEEAKKYLVKNDVYPLKICSPSNTLDEIRIHQSGETDYSCLTRLLGQYKKGIIYAFGAEGILVKDIVGINSRGLEEPCGFVIKDETTGDRVVSDDVRTHDPLVYKKSVDQWDKDEEKDESLEYIKSKWWKTKIIGGSYSICGILDSELAENQIENSKFLGSSLYGGRVVEHNKDLPVWKLGDVVEVSRKSDPETGTDQRFFIITQMGYTYDGARFNVRATLKGIDERGIIMNPTNNTLRQQEE